MDLAHETLTLSRDLDAPAGAVWNAYADVGLRVQWAAPQGAGLEYDGTDFRVGGVDRYRCGPPADLCFDGVQRYVLIEPEQCYVVTDEVSRDGMLLGVSLLTWRVDPLDAQRCRVTVVDQVTSFVGPGMIDGHREGNAATLDSLQRWLAAR